MQSQALFKENNLIKIFKKKKIGQDIFKFLQLPGGVA